MISLSLCMDRKNEEAVLERILKPVSQMMDAILIADTGSSDRTKEIAEQYTSQVFDFPWCDDFSAPRNFLLEKVRTDYWMWLDADDVLDEENLEKLKSLKETLDSGTDVVMMEYAVGFDQSGRTTFSYFRERIMKTSRNFRWNGAVHETVIPEGNIIYSDVVIRHRKCGKGDPDRNLRIYEKNAGRRRNAGTQTSALLWARTVLSSALSGDRGCVGGVPEKSVRMAGK